LDLELTPERFRVWGIRSVLSVLDQGLTSGAGFLVILFLARWLDNEAYGAFAVAFATLLLLSGFHSALLLDPMSVVGPANHSGQTVGYFQAQLKLHGILVVTLSVLLLLTSAAMAIAGVHRELVLALVGSALALPFLLLLWLVRRMCYVVHRPAMAVWGSAGYLASMMLGLFALHAKNLLNPFWVFVLMGATSVPVVLLLLWQLRLLTGSPVSPYSWKLAFRENWNYGRWILGSAVLYAVVGQTQTYMTAAFLGLGAAGIFRAVQIPSMVMTQVVNAVGLLVLPSMSSEWGVGRVDKLKKKALLSTSLVTAISLAYAFTLAIFAKPVERLLFGGKFSDHAWLIPVLALVPVCTGFAMGFSMALRASQKPHFDLLANAVSASVALISALVSIRAWGLAGAAISVVAGFGAYALTYFWSYKRWSNSAELLAGSTAWPTVRYL